MPDTLVSVLLPVWNGGRFLRSSLESLRRQSFRKFEVVAVDDGSTDGSHALLTRNWGFPITLIRHRRRQGITISLREAACAAVGQILARQDADDLSHPDRLARQVRLLRKQTDLVLVGCDFETIDEQGDRLSLERLPRQPENIASALAWRNVFAHGSILMRRWAYEKIGGYDPRMRFSQDLDLYVRLAETGKLGAVPGCLYQWRKNPKGVNGRLRDLQSAYASYLWAGKPHHRLQFIRARRRAWQYHFLGMTRLKEGDESGAMDSLREARRRAPENILTTYLLASLCRRRGRLPEARTLFGGLARKGPTDLRPGALHHLREIEKARAQ
ncbi:glycosyltransferase [bacterium]|nr:glycosyltransferase [bacterium]